MTDPTNTTAPTSAFDQVYDFGKKVPGYLGTAWDKSTSKVKEWAHDSKIGPWIKWLAIGIGTLMAFNWLKPEVDKVADGTVNAAGPLGFIMKPWMKPALGVLAFATLFAGSSFGWDKGMGVKSKAAEELFGSDDTPVAEAAADNTAKPKPVIGDELGLTTPVTPVTQATQPVPTPMGTQNKK